MSEWLFAGCPRLQIDGRWWRMLSPRWQHEPLSGAGAARSGGRWNARGVPALYLSATHATAIAEYMQSLIHPGTLAPYQVRASAILDLTNPDVREQLGVSPALLTLAWRRVRDVEKGKPESWEFADQAAAAGFDGMCVQSNQDQGTNLVLWRWSGHGASIELVDPDGEFG